MVLSARFDYYKKLNSDDKQKFLERVMKFAKDKEFIPRNEVDISDSMEDIRVLVSAAAIQVTFGLEEFEMPHFSKIFIYPHDYLNGMTHKWYKGETSLMGAIVFSWKDFKAGYADGSERMNLGLHEMAHALLSTNTIDEGRDDFFTGYFDKWWAISKVEFIKLEHHETDFFRAYGGTNQQEFFAVCVENFFTTPDEFKEKLPEIYRQTCILLNQDPSADFSNITQARTSILQNLANVTPQNLIYRTKGRSLLHATYSFGGFAVFGFFIVTSGIVSPLVLTLFGIAIVVLVFLLVRYIGYQEFYVYENAFAIGYERHGVDEEKMEIIGSPLCVSISFITIEGSSRLPDRHLIRLMHIEDGKLKSSDWKYNHLKSAQVQELKNAVKQYCEKQNIGFREEEEASFFAQPL